jgi:undecaprenyl-diphosphatase
MDMEALLRLDGNILLWIQDNLRNDFLDPIVKFITHSGDHGYLWIALLLVLFCIPKTRRAALIGAVTLILTFVITNLWLKPWIARTRPYEVVEGLTRIIGKQSDRSFPSGHTANSMAVGVSLWLISKKYELLGDKKLYFPKSAGWIVLIWSVLIGLSRLYVGVHYPTDVLGGAIVAIVDTLVVFHLYQFIYQKWAKK